MQLWRGGGKVASAAAHEGPALEGKLVGRQAHLLKALRLGLLALGFLTHARRLWGNGNTFTRVSPGVTPG